MTGELMILVEKKRECITAKCGFCGKFISNDAIQDNKVSRRYTPDSAFTEEEYYYVCEKCCNEESK